MKSSKLPWRVEREGTGIIDADGKLVVSTHSLGKHEWKPIQGQKKWEANAELIVKAVNNHERLVLNLEAVLGILDGYIEGREDERIYDIAMKALKAAKGEEP